MKLNKIIIVVFLSFGIILNLYSASAVMGVSPALYDVNFQPGYEGTFAFNFIIDSNVEAEVYAQGDLAEYVELNKKSIENGEGRIVATLKLPNEIDVPGTHIILIGARQKPKSEAGFALVGNMRGVIKVYVPYPGKYAEVSLKTENVNTGDEVPIFITINNLGKETIEVNPIMEILNYKNKIAVTNLESKEMESQKSITYSVKLNTSDYKAGDYNITITVNYGGKKPAVAKGIFRLGELNVRIINYTKNFERNKLNKIEIEVESLWNDPIENLYASVSIQGTDINFNTPSVNFAPWQINKLSGFFDTTSIVPDKFKADVVLHYYDKETRETLNLRFGAEPASYTTYLIIAAVVLGVLIIITLIIIIIILLRRTKKRTRK